MISKVTCRVAPEVVVERDATTSGNPKVITGVWPVGRFLNVQVTRACSTTPVELGNVTSKFWGFTCRTFPVAGPRASTRLTSIS